MGESVGTVKTGKRSMIYLRTTMQDASLKVTITNSHGFASEKNPPAGFHDHGLKGVITLP